MSSIPLFINLPIAPSLSKALTALERDGYFTVHLVKFDIDILKLMIAARPCATVFSITDEASYATTFEMLENLKRLHSANGEFARQPALRMILLAEHWGVTLERWMEVGIHEFIPAPIAKKALNFKLNRHYVKAVSSAAAAMSEAPCDPFGESEEEILVKGPDADSPPGRQTFYIPGAGGDLSGRSKHERIVIFANTPLLGTGMEVWTPAPASSGFEETWVTVIPGKTPAAPNEAVFFTGDKPVYDQQAKCWIFRGEAPKLVHRNTDSLVTDPNLFACSTDRSKIFVKSTGDFSKFEIKHQSTEKPVNPPRQNFFISGAEPIKKPYEVSPVKDIADFLDQWKPKERENATNENPSARIHGSGGISEVDPEAPEPRKSLPEAPLPGHYSGPGMRATESEFNTKVKPSPAKDASLARNDTRLRHHDAAAGNPPPEPEPEWPHEPVAAPDTETKEHDEEALAAGKAKPKSPAGTDEDSKDSDTPYRNIGQKNTEPDGKAVRRLGTDPVKPKPKGYGETTEDGKNIKTRMTFPIFAAGEQPKELRASSAPTDSADAEKNAALKRFKMDKEQSRADHVSKAETAGGFQNLSNEAEEVDELTSKIKNEKETPDEGVLIKHDAPEGSLTWSMQSDEAANAPKVKKQKKITDDGGRVLDVSLEPKKTAIQYEELVAENASATSPAPSGTGTPPASAAAQEPAPKKKESWLETVSRVLARIFS